MNGGMEEKSYLCASQSQQGRWPLSFIWQQQHTADSIQNCERVSPLGDRRSSLRSTRRTASLRRRQIGERAATDELAGRPGSAPHQRAAEDRAANGELAAQVS
jgi:hypothetical protein